MKFLFLDLLGSEDKDDRLYDKEWVKGFLENWGLHVGTPGEEEISRLKTLRQAIKNIIFAVNGNRNVDEEDLMKIRSALAGSQMTFALTLPAGEFKLSLQPVKQDWDWALHQIAASFAQVLSSEDMKRIKVCENPECRDVYFDESKNQTRRWCGTACGNLVKVREFRKRQKEKG